MGSRHANTKTERSVKSTCVAQHYVMKNPVLPELCDNALRTRLSYPTTIAFYSAPGSGATKPWLGIGRRLCSFMSASAAQCEQALLGIDRALLRKDQA
jgi:hypothetical protein